MPKTYVVRPTEVEVWTFEEFVAHGKQHAQSSVDGVPWSFEFNGRPITHENDDLYLIPITREGTTLFAPFARGDRLVVAADGSLFPCAPELFDLTYAPKEPA